MSDPRPRTESELLDFLKAIDARAPDSLHRQVQSLLAGRSSTRGFRAPRLAAAGAVAVAVAVLAAAIAVGTSGGGSSPMSLGQASALTLRAATAVAPAERNHTELAASVQGVSFPYWGERFGWRSTGARIDHVGGRTVTTIFYANGHGQRIGYAIVAGSAPLRPSGGVTSWHGGTPFHLLSVNRAPVVAWLRGGHLCVVSGRGVSSSMLLRLASWDGHGLIAS